MIRAVEAGGILAACALGIVCGTRLALSTGDRTTAAPVVQRIAPPVAERPAAPVAPALVPASVPSGWGARRLAAVDTMRTDFQQAPHLDQMFERGLRDPAGGGLFYARQALRYCGVLRGAGDLAPDAGPGGTLLGQARARCGALGDSASRQRLEATMGTSTSRLDPALSMIGELDDRLRADRLHGVDVAAALDAAVALGDPYVLRNVFFRGLSRIERYDGRPIDASLRGDLMTASRLAICDLGVDCPHEARVIVTCGSPPGCSTPLTALGLGDAALSDERRRAIADLSSRLVVAAGDGSLGDLFR